jgi:hydroxymethylglutaryl-CoA synthase
MSVVPPGEDVVTLAANAVLALQDKVGDFSDVDTLLFATESGADFSKASGIFVHQLLNLPARCRVVELKQACYAATAGLQLALPMLQQNPQKKILLLASDIARYEMNSAAESSQGSGAVAMLLSVNPRLLMIEPESGFYTKDCMDFWRPYYCDAALVDGRFSCDLYLHLLEETWRQYTKLSGRDFAAHDYFCYHTPVPKLVESAHKRLIKINGGAKLSAQQLSDQLNSSLCYNRETGNSYTASLYISIISLLENIASDLTDKRLGLYSYGSGCSGEFFSAKIMKNYQKMLFIDRHKKVLANRKELNYKEFEEFYNFKLPQDGSNFMVPLFNTGQFRLCAMEKHKRIYERVA